MGSTNEILPSDFGPGDFDEWRARGEDVATFVLESS
jgi:hypothetical protein